jgi:hypothetical protein
VSQYRARVQGTNSFFSECDRSGGTDWCHIGRFHHGLHRKTQHCQVGSHSRSTGVDSDRDGYQRTHVDNGSTPHRARLRYSAVPIVPICKTYLSQLWVLVLLSST